MKTIMVLLVFVSLVYARAVPYHRLVLQSEPKPLAKIRHAAPKLVKPTIISRVDLEMKASMVSDNFQRSILQPENHILLF